MTVEYAILWGGALLLGTVASGAILIVLFDIADSLSKLNKILSGKKKEE